MQEAFARAAALPPGSVNELDAWLFRVVHNLAVDAHRRASRLDSIREIAPASGDADADERLSLWQEVSWRIDGSHSSQPRHWPCSPAQRGAVLGPLRPLPVHPA